MYDRFGLFIDGRWSAAQDGETAPVHSPVSERALGLVPVAGVVDTRAAIASAAAGFAAWKAKPAFDRADALHRIAAITRFSNDDEVLVRANASDMGLSAYAFTTNPKRARRTVAELKAGMVGINSFAMAASEAPFGGTNHSGMGREGGIEAIRDYLDVKSSQMVWA